MATFDYEDALNALKAALEIKQRQDTIDEEHIGQSYVAICLVAGFGKFQPWEETDHYAD